MDKKFEKEIRGLKRNNPDKMIVSSFLRKNSLAVSDGFLMPYTGSTVDWPMNSIEDVIEAFGILAEGDSGAVYTPEPVRKYMVNSILSIKGSLDNLHILDPSCGCGALLYTVAESMTGTYTDRVHHLYGVDICPKAVERAKILLSLAALLHGETLNDEDFNIYQGNALDFDFHTMGNTLSHFISFDVVIGNPPYVTARSIDPTSLSLMKEWPTANCGTRNLYIPFFEIGLETLASNGVLCYISPNSYFKSINGRNLRKYLRNKGDVSITDFGNEKVFKAGAYTCITTVSVASRGRSVEYATGHIVNGTVKATNPTEFHNEVLDDRSGWNLTSGQSIDNIRKIEGTGRPLKELFPIRYGVATLANDVFIFKPQLETPDGCVMFMKNDRMWRIEKDICRPIVNPARDTTEMVIFPYSGGKAISEDTMRGNYPLAYSYLQDNKERLAMRDKGKKTYEQWYAFGRSQGMTEGQRMVMPFMGNNVTCIPIGEALYYSAYGIYGTEWELKVLRQILESSVFKYYISNTSRRYAGGFYSLAKGYIGNFGIPHLSDEQQERLSSLSGDERDRYVEELYDVTL